MNIALNKPYHFFFLIVPIILAFRFSKSKGIFNINIHDTYFVIKYAHLGIILSVFLFFTWIYSFFYIKKRHRNKQLDYLFAYHFINWGINFDLDIIKINQQCAPTKF